MWPNCPENSFRRRTLTRYDINLIRFKIKCTDNRLACKSKRPGVMFFVFPETFCDRVKRARSPPPAPTRSTRSRTHRLILGRLGWAGQVVLGGKHVRLSVPRCRRRREIFGRRTDGVFVGKPVHVQGAPAGRRHVPGQGVQLPREAVRMEMLRLPLHRVSTHVVYVVTVRSGRSDSSRDPRCYRISVFLKTSDFSRPARSGSSPEVQSAFTAGRRT